MDPAIIPRPFSKKNLININCVYGLYVGLFEKFSSVKLLVAENIEQLGQRNSYTYYTLRMYVQRVHNLCIGVISREIHTYIYICILTSI